MKPWQISMTAYVTVGRNGCCNRNKPIKKM